MSSKADDLRQWAVYCYRRGLVDDACYWLSLAQLLEVLEEIAPAGTRAGPPEHQRSAARY